jgi:hypothetical protein
MRRNLVVAVVVVAVVAVVAVAYVGSRDPTLRREPTWYGWWLEVRLT